MQIHASVRLPSGNDLLDRLSDETYSLLSPHLRHADLAHGRVIYEEWQPVSTMYFPSTGAISATVVTHDGRSIEVANVGREGVSGVSALFGLQPSIHRLIVQSEGAGLRIELDTIRRMAEPGDEIHRLFLRYFNAFLAQVSQSVACNGLHGVKQRCCRWLLMTQDRLRRDELALTHEFLAIMLGVRRASISEILKLLEDDGLVRRRRGKIVIIDRQGMLAASCECYCNVEAAQNRLLGTSNGKN